jgi:Stress responsive A/B Barrel Domain.
MIKHIVFWKIQAEGSPEKIEQVYQEFSKKTAYLQTIIPEIKEARVALNCSKSDFDLCIDSVFDSMDTLNTYIEHPEHLKVREYLNSVTCAKAVFDYEY